MSQNQTDFQRHAHDHCFPGFPVLVLSVESAELKRQGERMHLNAPAVTNSVAYSQLRTGTVGLRRANWALFAGGFAERFLRRKRRSYFPIAAA